MAIKDIGLRVKNIRLELNLNQSDFAEGIGIKQAGISAIEKGIRSLTDRNITYICHTYNVNEEWLRTGQGEMFTPKKSMTFEDYVRQNKITSLEADLIKSYLSVEPSKRDDILNAFKHILNIAKPLNLEKQDESLIGKNNLSDDETSATSNIELENFIASVRIEAEKVKKGEISSASQEKGLKENIS